MLALGLGSSDIVQLERVGSLECPPVSTFHPVDRIDRSGSPFTGANVAPACANGSPVLLGLRHLDLTRAVHPAYEGISRAVQV